MSLSALYRVCCNLCTSYQDIVNHYGRDTWRFPTLSEYIIDHCQSRGTTWKTLAEIKDGYPEVHFPFFMIKFGIRGLADFCRWSLEVQSISETLKDKSQSAAAIYVLISTFMKKNVLRIPRVEHTDRMNLEISCIVYPSFNYDLLFDRIERLSENGLMIDSIFEAKAFEEERLEKESENIPNADHMLFMYCLFRKSYPLGNKKIQEEMKVASFGKRTIKPRTFDNLRTWLIDHEYIYTPNGPKGGVMLTSKGIRAMMGAGPDMNPYASNPRK